MNSLPGPYMKASYIQQLHALKKRHILSLPFFISFTFGFQRVQNPPLGISSVSLLRLLSRPTELLENTSSGISCINTLKHLVHIVVKNDRLQVYFLDKDTEKNNNLTHFTCKDFFFLVAAPLDSQVGGTECGRWSYG